MYDCSIKKESLEVEREREKKEKKGFCLLKLLFLFGFGWFFLLSKLCCPDLHTACLRSTEDLIHNLLARAGIHFW